MPTIVTPEVGRMHWDDLLRQFRVCASIQVDGPLGINPHYEACVTAGDLVTALNFITKTFTTVGSGEPGTKLTMPIGDPTDLIANLALAAAFTQVVPDLPAVPTGNEGPADGLDPDPTDFGVTE